MEGKYHFHLSPVYVQQYWKFAYISILFLNEQQHELLTVINDMSYYIRIAADLKVGIDIFASPIGRDVILVLIFGETFKTHTIIFIGLTCHNVTLH